MMRRLTAILLTGALMAAPAGRSAGAAASSPLEQIDALIRSEMQAARIPGVSLGVVQDGKVVQLKGYGEASPGRPMLARTPMILGSVSKPITALAVMQLAEAGKIDLDAPVRKYLPWFRLADEQVAGQITVRHLLSHTSGLTTADGQAPLLDDGTQTLEEGVYALRAVTPAGPPGETYRYSNVNYNILGLIVQTVSGRPYGEYLRDRIFTPLKMERSYTSEEPARREFMAEGYQMWLGFPATARVPYPNSAVPSGYIISTAADMAQFVAAQLSGGAGVLSPQGIAAMQQPAVQVKGDFAYGLGWAVRKTGDVPTVRHMGETPTFRAEVVLLPEADAGFVLLSNIFHPLARPAFDRMVTGITAILAGRPAPAPGWFGRNLWIAYDLVFLAAAALMFWSLESLQRWRARLEGAGRRAPWLALGAIGLHLAVALGLSYGVPAVAGGTWSHVQLFAPDIGRTLAIAVIVNFMGAVGRTVLAWNVLRSISTWNNSQRASEKRTA